MFTNEKIFFGKMHLNHETITQDELRNWFTKTNVTEIMKCAICQTYASTIMLMPACLWAVCSLSVENREAAVFN